MKNTPVVRRRAQRRGVGRSSGAALTPHCKIWLERDGKVALSDWRVELLEAIQETGSLATAAKRLKVPYRTAWYKLKEIEGRLGVGLLVSESGGVEGGGSHLTDEAQQIIRHFRRVMEGVQELVERRFSDEFTDRLPASK